MKVVSIDEQQLAESKPGFWDRQARDRVLAWLQHIKLGHLSISDGANTFCFGENKSTARLCAHLDIHQITAYRDILLNGMVGAGEAYIRGSWSSPDLLKVIRLMCINKERLQVIDSGWALFNRYVSALWHRLHANSKTKARLNIAAHYDLGNAFFKLFLDETMMYSSAIFPTIEADLLTASHYKMAHICERLQLTAQDHLLEIGTGWGGMALYAAEHYGCQVTTTTISQAQYAFACEKVKQHGLAHKITVLLDDYRDLVDTQSRVDKQYDKLVSIEMIEAVGHRYYRDYFDVCSRLLKPGGKMLIQAITVPDQRYESTKHTTDFIQRYIFPGGELPCLTAIANCLTRYTDMQIVNLDDITRDYAETLAHWRAGFFTQLHNVKAQGFDDKFIRMWDFYLCYCEGGFRERTISTVQLLMAKPGAQSLPAVTH